MVAKTKPSTRKIKQNKGKVVATHSTPAWLWLLTGLLVGLFVALLLYMQVRVAPEIQKNTVTSSVQSGNKAADPFTFDFYKLLPNMEVDVPQDQPAVDNKDPMPSTSINKKGTYVLQVGSFKNFSDADKLKATLALQGLVSRIVAVNVKQKNWYRVYIGPYSSTAELNETRRQLHQNKIDSLVVKLKG